jgi:hypothetical protein
VPTIFLLYLSHLLSFDIYTHFTYFSLHTELLLSPPSLQISLKPSSFMMFRAVFWVVLPCKMIVDRRFRGTYCLHHHP